MAINLQTFDGGGAITPSDTADNFWESIFVGGAGNVTVVTPFGDTVEFTAPAAGFVLPIRVVKVKATGTTATNLVGLK